MPPNFSGLEMPSRPRSPAFLENFVDREATVLFPFVDVRVDFLLDEILDRAAQFFVFLGKDHLWFSLFYPPLPWRERAG